MKFSLSFMWIEANAIPMPNDIDQVTCPIPKKLMDNVVLTAKSYPDVPVSLWVDIYGVGNNTPSILRKLNEVSPEPNITFRALDDIRVYQINPLFSKPSINLDNPHDPLWQRVDLARLLAIDYSLVNDDVDAAIYSDMDRLLVKKCLLGKISGHFKQAMPSLYAPWLETALDKIKKHGMVTGKDSNKSIPENQFMGFSKNRQMFLRDVLIFNTAKVTNEGDNGWRGHIATFNKLALRPFDLSISQVTCHIPTIDPDKKIRKEYVKLRSRKIFNPVFAQFLPQQL
jgi:hypothetical protein